MQSTDDFQTQVLQRLDALKADVDKRFTKLESDFERANSRVDKWEERFLQLSRDNLTIARTVIIAAATVVILGSLLDKAEVLIAGIARLFGKS
jgi:hypothetical protein